MRHFKASKGRLCRFYEITKKLMSMVHACMQLQPHLFNKHLITRKNIELGSTRPYNILA